MKPAKRMLALVALCLVFTLCAALYGCAKPAPAKGPEATPGTTPATQPEATPETTPEATPETKSETEPEGRTLTVGFDAEFAPYGYMDENGEYTGFDLEMAQTLCERLGWAFKCVPIDWNSKDFELESGAIDCIWNGFTINDRESLYAWTAPYMDNSQVFVVRAGEGIATQAELAGKIVTVQMESSAQAALEEEENAALMASFKSLNTCKEYNTAFLELESGAVDAIAMDIGVARFQMEGREEQFVILEDALQAEQYGVGFFLQNTALRDEVEAELLKMVEDGTFKAISEKWFGYDVCILGK